VRTIAYRNVVDVEWDPSPSTDVAGYQVYRKLPADLTWPATPLNTTGVVLDTKYRDATVVNGTLYVYRVTAVRN
jgi:hypothetical protein